MRSKPAEFTLHTRLRSTDVFIVPRINETRPRATRFPLQKISTYASCWGPVSSLLCLVFGAPSRVRGKTASGIGAWGEGVRVPRLG